MTTLNYLFFSANNQVSKRQFVDCLSKNYLVIVLCLFSFYAFAAEKSVQKDARKPTKITIATNKSNPKTTIYDEMTDLISPSQLTNAQESLNQELTPEGRAKLQHELYEYNSTIDPGHLQIEERRRIYYKRLVERFEQCDPDNDGTISPIEAAEFMPQIARHFNTVDTNNDNLISLEELVVAQNKAEERRMASRFEGNKIEAKLDNNTQSDLHKHKPKHAVKKKTQL